MSASDAGGSSANAIGLGSEAVDGIARSLTLPRALIDANLRAGSALLGFAGQCVHAEAELFEQLAARENVALVAAGAGPAPTIRSA
ncbi:MAG: hypothetical protein ABSF67_03025 [Roseiarcus sp.]|jgi:hypothetical protein